MARSIDHTARWIGLLALLALGSRRRGGGGPPAPPIDVEAGGGVLTLAELRALAASVGFPDPDLAAAVAMAESAGNTHATHVSDIEASFGLWQVNVRAHPEYQATELLDPEANARAAYAISRGGLDWHPWTTFQTGAYRRWMPGAGA